LFGQMQVTRMFQLSKLETVDEAVAKLLELTECPKARAYDALSCQMAAERLPPQALQPALWGHLPSALSSRTAGRLARSGSKHFF